MTRKWNSWLRYVVIDNVWMSQKYCLDRGSALRFATRHPFCIFHRSASMLRLSYEERHRWLASNIAHTFVLSLLDVWLDSLDCMDLSQCATWSQPHVSKISELREWHIVAQAAAGLHCSYSPKRLLNWWLITPVRTMLVVVWYLLLFCLPSSSATLRLCLNFVSTFPTPGLDHLKTPMIHGIINGTQWRTY